MRSVKYIPRATEKSYVAQTQNVYMFFVPQEASKQAIKQAIAEEFKVTVLDVRTANRKGKATRFSRGKHAYPGIAYRADQKVAYITVKAGDKIPVFDEDKADDKASKKSDDKKADEKAVKSEKTTKEKATKTAKADAKETK